MKIIKQGTIIKSPGRRKTCQYCKCIFEFTNDDTIYDQREQMLIVTCPCCKNILEVK